ncbi:MAG TPA: 1-acyl-sn-glycerol-3-phosphate acyltransferase, partial [Actinomycetota bacterium]|nr:1-acyl-sn-glycerol-3-phosphate acyltransferase [Actinomycetota bacterium]
MGHADVISLDGRRQGDPGRCRGRLADGRPCRNRAGGNGFCKRHETAAAADTQPSRFEQELERALSFLRRRLTGNYPTDDFGFDQELTETVLLPILRPLFERWWRIEQRGLENIPQTGPALLVANHSGTLPLDALMVKYGVYEGLGRHCRLLAADLPFRLPFIGELARKSGNTLACTEDTTRLLDAGQLVGVFPEGYKGIGKPFRERYKLQRFGRGGFVEVALKTGVPIVPVAIVGAEEIYPIIANLKPLARLLGFPYFPITPTFPLLGPLGAVPLPSKWVIEYGEPIATAHFTPDAALDPMFV